MRILFGVQGTGNGHISRCRTLANALADQGAEVDFILSGRDADKYFDVDAFGQFRCYKGMSFVTQNGRISLFKTIKKLHAVQLINDIRRQDLSSYDRIISDFEPITAWAAKWQNKPVLGISNQAIFNYIPPKEQDVIAKIVMKHYAPVTKLIGLHWFHFGYPILPPIIDPMESSGENGTIIIYLPFEKLEKITHLLADFTHHNFICFHPEIKQPSQKGQICFMPLNRIGFVDALRQSSGILTNAGFALVSEALSLGKKILVKPLKGQFEQIYKADCLHRLELASVMKKLNKASLAAWLELPSPAAVVYPNVAEALAKWIVNGEKQSIAELSNDLWQRTVFPQHTLNRLSALGLNKPIELAGSI
jgi:uncharacterized protein (TIGR00661 family)